MSQTMNENATGLDSLAAVEMAINDPELKKLPIGSEELKAALDSKMNPGKTENNDESADVDSEVTDEGDLEDEEKPQEPKKKSRGMLRRIEKLVEEKAELARRLQEVESKTKVSEPQRQEPQGPEFPVHKPKFADFNSVEEYTEALTDWKLAKKDFEARVAYEHHSVVQETKKIAQTWDEREATVKKEISDYQDVVNVDALQRLEPSIEARVFFVESEFGPQVMYSLLSDKALAKSFTEASPVKQVAMLGKLEAQLESSNRKQTAVTRAPNPPKPFPKSKPVSLSNNLITAGNQMSDKEFLKLWDETFK